jgi:hypothetical protein
MAKSCFACQCSQNDHDRSIPGVFGACKCGRCEEFKEKPASTVVATSGSTFFGKSGGKQSGPRGSGRSSSRAPKISTPRKMV